MMANNIAKEYIDFSKKNINKYLKLILDKYYNKKVANDLITTYINIRYYNDYELKYKNLDSNINYYLKEKALELSDNENEMYILQVKNMFYIFKYILYFDDVIKYDSLKKIILEIEQYRNVELGLVDDDFVSMLFSLIKENDKRKEKFLNNIQSEHFMLNLMDTNKRNVYIVKLDNDVKFNKIYSDYSINKVYNEGIVNEKKNMILYYLVSKMILEDAISGVFNRYYIVDFPISILEKEQKLNRLINIIDSEVVKNSMIIKFMYNDYLSNKEIINKFIKDGFQIAIVIDDNYKYDDSSRMWLDIFKYVIVNNENKNFFEKEKVIMG